LYNLYVAYAYVTLIIHCLQSYSTLASTWLLIQIILYVLYVVLVRTCFWFGLLLSVIPSLTDFRISNYQQIYIGYHVEKNKNNNNNDYISDQQQTQCIGFMTIR